eukprot:4615696-Prymnesium_polylepis.2
MGQLRPSRARHVRHVASETFTAVELRHVPGAQTSHVDPPVLLDVPCGHGTHVSVRGSMTRPMGQLQLRPSGVGPWPAGQLTLSSKSPSPNCALARAREIAYRPRNGSIDAAITTTY